MDAFANGWWGLGRAAAPDRGGHRRAVVVAVPVRDEERRIVACLERLTDQRAAGCSLAVILLLNNCRDGTADAVRALARRRSCPVTMLQVELPAARAHVGWARRLAMDEAADRLEALGSHDGIILTTDADTLVDRDWVSANVAEIAAGADAVAGALDFDPADELALPAGVRRRARLECHYATLAAEIDTRLDPVAHDPWPAHRAASGASLAVTLAAYRRVGGMPASAVGEDRAFVERLTRRDLRVRHSPGTRVTTSRRAIGRAAGGMADTLRMQATLPDLPCDPALEAIDALCRRARSRATIRRLAKIGRLRDTRRWAPALGLTAEDAGAAVATPWLGEAWARIEAASPVLRRVPLLPSTLAREISQARALLRELTVTGFRLRIAAGHPDDKLTSDAA